MSRRALNILAVLILMMLSAIVSIFVYINVVGGSGEASQPISAPTLAIPTPNQAETRVAIQSTMIAQLVIANGTLSVAAGTPPGLSLLGTEPTSEARAVATSEATAESTAYASASTGTLYRISSDGSQASFTLTEDLFNQPKTVVGTTSQVAGDIFVDFETPSNSQIGQIHVNVRTLTTDSELRNNALRSSILQSTNPNYEYAIFTPTAITGLPDKIEAGQELKFQITGDLKIRDITQSVTFDVTATLVSADQLKGTATAGVTREQFNLTIPRAPGVANVSDAVALEIDFIAYKVQQ